MFPDNTKFLRSFQVCALYCSSPFSPLQLRRPVSVIILEFYCVKCVHALFGGPGQKDCVSVRFGFEWRILFSSRAIVQGNRSMSAAAAASPAKGKTGDPSQGNRYISTNVLINNKLNLQTPVQVGHGTVIHHRVQLLATNGPIDIGDYCVIDDEAVVENVLPFDPSGKPQTLRIGHANHIWQCAEAVRAARHHVKGRKQLYRQCEMSRDPRCCDS